MLTGCKSTKTTVVVVNKTNNKLSIVASAKAEGKTYKFNKKNIPNGKDRKQNYVTKLKKNTVVNFVISSVKIGSTNVPGPYPDLVVLAGRTNTFTVFPDGSVTAKVK